MDITLERILSLIPRKPDGKYVHGAKKAFADTLGLPHNIVMEWESGKSRSYRNYLYEIADKYNVSVEWLRGETDIKEKPTAAGELTDKELKLLELFKSASPELRAAAMAVLESAEK